MAYIDKIQVGGTNYDLQDTPLGNRVGVLEPAATNSDIGKALIVKTVSGGKAASYEFGEAGGGVDPSVIEEAVDEWLDEHPEATTTVEDGSITYAKLADNVLTYVTPEKFGAAGDGATDDTTAIQNCIDYAKTNKVAVRGFKRYKTTSPITISGTYMDVLIDVITYTGNECGLIVKGSYHTIRVMQLYCSNGGAVVYKADSGNIAWINFQANRVFAKSHAVDLQTSGNYWILYNTFNIRAIKSDTGNCYNGTNQSTENVFYNSSCTCESGWAIYGCSGRFYNFTLESDVLNGICVTYGQNYFAGFRYREMVDKLIARVNGVNPSATGGTLIKFYDANQTMTKFVGNDMIPYEAIDVADMYTPEEGIEEYTEASYADRPVILAKMSRLSRYQEIDAPICYGNWDTQNGFAIIGKKMFVQGGRKICVPYYETEYEITSADYDMRDARVALDDAKIYPTKMIIGVDSCVIHLPASYCPVGYSEFIVDQTNHTCTIYDYNNSTTPIFNGSVRGAGVYRLKAQTDLDGNAIQTVDTSSTQKLFDTSNYSWEIEKIGGSGGGSVTLNYVTPEDYGAVGDGVTDDSEAVQDACDAGYNVYFASNKTYYLASTVTVNHDIHLYGGKGATIKTTTPSGGIVNDAIVVTGTLKKTTTMTTDYTSDGSTANSGNQFTLSDMTGIAIGDIMIVEATDQYYSYARQYYHLGATLLVGDIANSHIYTTDSLPFDIENTENVSVKIYSAPTAIIENLNFVSDLDSRGNYKYCIKLIYSKNSIVRNTSITQMDNGLQIYNCVNTLVDCVTVSKSKNDNTLSGDGYGIGIYSSSDTIVQRVESICSQACITLSGSITILNTHIRNCNLASECRPNAIGSHENCYNTVIEDCVLTNLNVLGTAIVNRCRFIKNNRISPTNTGISFCGSHNPKYATLRVSNCTFEEDSAIYLLNPTPQDPVESFDSIIGLVEIKDCENGMISFSATTPTGILSNSIKEVRLTGWKNCKEFYFPSSAGIIEKMIVNDCSFTRQIWLNDHNNNLMTGNVYDLDYKSTFPMQHKISFSKTTYGEKYTLPESTPIQLSSNNSSAKFIVTGKNLVSDNADDYAVGSVSGNEGAALVRTPSTGSSVPTVSIDSNGNLVFTQKSNTSSYCVYPLGMFYVSENSTLTMTASLVNSGETSAASFRPMIAVVDCSTGYVQYRGWGTAVEATSQGATITHSRAVPANCVAMCYYYCSTAVSGAETTFENYTISLSSLFAPASISSSEPYIAVRRTGDGSVYSVGGVNNIMCSESQFHVYTIADYVSSAGQGTIDATGVSF